MSTLTADYTATLATEPALAGKYLTVVLENEAYLTNARARSRASAATASTMVGPDPILFSDRRRYLHPAVRRAHARLLRPFSHQRPPHENDVTPFSRCHLPQLRRWLHTHRPRPGRRQPRRRRHLRRLGRHHGHHYGQHEPHRRSRHQSGFRDHRLSARVVSGTTHAGGATASQAHTDLITAFNTVTGQTATTSGVTAFATTTLSPGVYHAADSLSLTGILTLDGGGLANPVFVFKMGSTLLTDLSTQVLLINGARAENVYWRVGTSATLGGASVFVGNIFADASISLGNGTSVDGRLLAINGAVTLIGNTVSIPASAIPEPATTGLLVAGFFGLMIGARRFHQRRAAARAASV